MSDLLRSALRQIIEHPTTEINPDGDDQAAWSMQLIAREALTIEPEQIVSTWNAVPLRETILAVLTTMPPEAAPEHLAAMIEGQVRAWLDIQANAEPEYEYRAVAAEDNGNPEEFSPWDLREEEARRELARYLGPDYADPPYIVGWIERTPIVRPERIS